MIFIASDVLYRQRCSLSPAMFFIAIRLLSFVDESRHAFKFLACLDIPGFHVAGSVKVWD
jgi:hypothetical protein